MGLVDISFSWRKGFGKLATMHIGLQTVPFTYLGSNVCCLIEVFTRLAVIRLKVKAVPLLFRSAIVLLALITVTACGAMLPHGEEKTGTRWTRFEEVMQAYEAVEPFTSTKDDLARLGFTPDIQPNVKILNHVEVLDKLVPNNIYEDADLPKGIRACLMAGKACSAYEYNQTEMHIRRYGGFLADFLNFKRKTETTGWSFSALFVMTGNDIVYKMWSGTPEILTYKETVNPLGPLQGAGPSISIEAVKP